MKIALGTAQFGSNYGIANKSGKINYKEAKKILNLAKKNKINTIDTAINYLNSEKILGRIGVSKFNIITKLPAIPKKNTNIEKWIRNELHKSLKRLKIKRIYGLLLHNPEDILRKDSNKILDILIKIKKENLIKKIGISIYDFDNLDDIKKIANIDIVQCPLNILDRRLIKYGLLNKLYKKKIEIHVRSIFLQGLLLLSIKNIPKKFIKWNYIFQKLNDWEIKNKINRYELCINYIKKFNKISKVIVGIDNFIQAKKLFKYIKKKPRFNFPNIQSSDNNLINPSKW
jgi:aryl-alcohol dehydrogenase-like predicted oxidoreductase